MIHSGPCSPGYTRRYSHLFPPIFTTIPRIAKIHNRSHQNSQNAPPMRREIGYTSSTGSVASLTVVLVVRPRVWMLRRPLSIASDHNGALTQLATSRRRKYLCSKGRACLALMSSHPNGIACDTLVHLASCVLHRSILYGQSLFHENGDSDRRFRILSGVPLVHVAHLCYIVNYYRRRKNPIGSLVTDG